MPPIGYRPQPPCLVDAGLLALDAGARDGAQPLLYCGAGTAGCALALTPRALLAATAGRAVDLAQDPAGPAPPSAGGSALPDADQMTRKQALPPPWFAPPRIYCSASVQPHAGAQMTCPKCCVPTNGGYTLWASAGRSTCLADARVAYLSNCAHLGIHLLCI